MRLHPTKYTTAYIVLVTWPDARMQTFTCKTRQEAELQVETLKKANNPELYAGYWQSAYASIHEITQALPVEEKS